MTVLGFDPGLNRTGYAVLKEAATISIVGAGLISPSADQLLNQRYSQIFFSARKVLTEYHPDVVAVEEIYFAKNAQTTLKIGMVRGLLFAAALERGIEVASFSPAAVKMAVCGKGNATKEQVQYLAAAVLGLKKQLPEDTADALAVALCYLNDRKYQSKIQAQRQNKGT